MASSTVRVKGLKELNRAINKADKDTKKLLKARFVKVGDIVRDEGRSRFSSIDAGSAAGFQSKALVSGVKVQQSKRKTTGRRGDYGSLQMRRALLPALDAKQSDVVDELEKALDDIADIINRA
jgi:hypothetical protein